IALQTLASFSSFSRHLFSLCYQAHSDLAQALDSNSNPHQALAPKDFLSECLYPFHHPKGSHRRGITASSFLNRGSYSAGGHEFYLSYIFRVGSDVFRQWFSILQHERVRISDFSDLEDRKSTRLNSSHLVISYA